MTHASQPAPEPAAPLAATALPASSGEQQRPHGAARSSSDAGRARQLGWLAWLALAGVIACFQAPALWASIEYTSDLSHINNDARQQIYPFYRYVQPGVLEPDYVADYYLACFPLGYWALYAGSAALGVDPAILSHILPHVLWLLTAVGLCAVAHALAGRWGALCALALCLGSNAYLVRMGGGLPRAFGFPLLTLLLVGLAYARERLVIAAIVLGALFYPVVGLISGMVLAAALLLPERLGCGLRSRPLRQRLLLLGATALVSVAVLVPPLLAARPFGSLVRPSQLEQYPEIGPGGRYGPESRPPFPGFFQSLPDALDPALLAAEGPWLPAAREWLVGDAERPWEGHNYRRVRYVLLALMLAGGLGLAARKPAARRIALVAVASGVGYQVAALAVPHAYLPERYSLYTGTLLGTLAVAACPVGLLPVRVQSAARGWLRHALLGAYVAAVLGLFAGPIARDTGVDIELEPARPLLSFIASLPAGAQLAAWPRGLADNIPYATRRRVLVTYETHQAFHEQYILEMRRRMRALLDAYFAVSLAPIERLRDEHGVSHLLLQESHLRRRAPHYFAPFDAWIGERATRRQRYELLRQIPNASVLKFGDYRLLDLSRLAARPAP